IEQLTFARELEKKVKDMSIGMNHENIEAMNKEMERVMALKDEWNALRDAIDNSPMAGINEGFKKYMDDAGTVRDQWADATTTAFNGMTDAFARFASGTQTDFRQMTVSVLQDLSQILIKASMINALKNAQGSGGFFGAISDLFKGAGFYSDGGYTGAGGVYEPAGIVHKGEVVFSQRDVARFGGVSAVENMRVRGYANGGVVGGGYVVNNNYSQQSQQQPISITVNVAEDGSTEIIDNSAGRAFDRQIEVVVNRVIAKEKRPGGKLAK
ncbi:MAG: phage tail tape measure C-terminal domain-containing protein, partial [Wohlfahrtiimonas sp.]